MRHVRRREGFALIELLVVMTVSLVLLSGTLLTFERFISNSQENDKRNDTAEQARNSLEIEARQLRNLAKRVNNVAVISTVAPDDLVFQTSDPTRTWVRYCLDTSLGAERSRVWEQTQGSDTPGQTTSCGPSAAGWATSRVAASAVVNRIDGRDAPLFRYRCVGGGTACTGSSSAFDKIIGVDAQLLVDTTPRKGPEELKVSSGVFLRNQNQAPTAVMSSTPVGSQPRTVQLNASASSDFEGRTLQYFWFAGIMPATIRCDQPKETVSGGVTTLWGGRFIGRGVVLQYQWPATVASPGTVGLVACDPGDRYGYTGPQFVNIP